MLPEIYIKDMKVTKCVIKSMHWKFSTLNVEKISNQTSSSNDPIVNLFNHNYVSYSHRPEDWLNQDHMWRLKRSRSIKSVKDKALLSFHSSKASHSVQKVKLRCKPFYNVKNSTFYSMQGFRSMTLFMTMQFMFGTCTWTLQTDKIKQYRNTARTHPCEWWNTIMTIQSLRW